MKFWRGNSCVSASLRSHFCAVVRAFPVVVPFRVHTGGTVFRVAKVAWMAAAKVVLTNWNLWASTQRS